jgi:hypothetical protein
LFTIGKPVRSRLRDQWTGFVVSRKKPPHRVPFCLEARGKIGAGVSFAEFSKFFCGQKIGDALIRRFGFNKIRPAGLR